MFRNSVEVEPAGKKTGLAPVRRVAGISWPWLEKAGELSLLWSGHWCAVNRKPEPELSLLEKRSRKYFPLILFIIKISEKSDKKLSNVS